MAYDKIIVIHSRLDHCLDYTLNEESSPSKRLTPTARSRSPARC